MRKPLPRNEAINGPRVKQWLDDFAMYRHQVSENRLDRWIDQFKEGDRDIAARVLDAVDFFGNERISAVYRDLLNALPGWHRDERRREGKWRFAAYSASAGESGDAMLRVFRHANNLAAKKYSDMFISRSDLLRSGLGPDDTVVLVDDFVGTGDQVCDSWSIFGELLATVGRSVLLVAAGRREAIKRIEAETDLVVVAGIELTARDSVFSGACKHFTDAEKDIIEAYGKIAKKAEPRGYGDCGLLLVFGHTCPNNTIPILHASSQAWEGLFRRYD